MSTRLHRVPMLRYMRSRSLPKATPMFRVTALLWIAIAMQTAAMAEEDDKTRHRPGPWQVACAQLRGVEAQSGRLVDQHWAAPGRHGHVVERDLARRQGNSSVGDEVRKCAKAICYASANRRPERNIRSMDTTRRRPPTGRKRARIIARRRARLHSRDALHNGQRARLASARPSPHS